MLSGSNLDGALERCADSEVDDVLENDRHNDERDQASLNEQVHDGVCPISSHSLETRWQLDSRKKTYT